MNTGIAATLAFLLFIVLLFAGFAAGIIYLNSQEAHQDALVIPTTTTSTTTAPTTTTSEPMSTTSSSYQPTTSVASSTTTSTIAQKTMRIDYSPKMLYKMDEVLIDVLPGEDIESRVYLDGKFVDTFKKASYRLLNLASGSHKLIIEKRGYVNGSIEFEVDEKTYANSLEARQKKSPLERARAIAEGKASIRFYDSSSCSICRAMLPKLNAFVDNNRDCIMYEKLTYWRYPDEVIAGTLPTIVVEGRNGLFKTNGQTSMTQVRNMVRQASGCDVK